MSALIPPCAEDLEAEQWAQRVTLAETDDGFKGYMSAVEDNLASALMLGWQQSQSYKAAATGSITRDQSYRRSSRKRP